MNALEKPLSSRGRYEPTFYGRLLDSLPLSFDASILALKFGQVGILREGIIISILMDVQPPPIYHPFGNQNLYVENYFDSSSCKPIAKKEASLMANLCAFQFWERVFKDKHRLERLKHVVNVDEFSYSEVLFSKLEEEWCSFHNLIQTSLHTLSEIYEETVEILHRFRPSFLAKIKIPCYFEPYTFKHTCILQSEPAPDLDALTLEDENLDTATRQKCITLPYVAPDDFGATSVSEKLKSLVKEMRMQYVEDTSGFLPNTATVSQANEPAICKFFAIGACNKGDLCHYSHSYQSERPLCRFFHTFQGCRNGNACFFLHDYSSSGRRASNFCLQEDATTSADSFLQLLPTMSYEYILILNDNDLFFSVNLAQIYDANKIIATTHRSYSEFEESLGIRALCDVAEPWYAITKSNEISIPWEQVRCILWFADIEDDAARHYHLLQDLFRHLAVKILADTLFDIRVIITINNVKFAQLQVEKLARECFFILTESFCFDESSFGNFSGSKKTTRLNNHISVPVSYVFELYPPTNLQFGDYSAVLQKGLYRQ